MIVAITARLINLLPKKMTNYISNIIVNKYLSKYANINVVGSENLKGVETPTIFVCNHLSNSDGLVLAQALKEINPTFVAGEKLSNDAVTNIGVNVVKTTNIKPNTTDKEGIKKLIKLIDENESLLIFPEGTRSRSGSLIEGKKGILLIARMAKAPIVPIGLYGTERLLPISKEGEMSKEKFNYADVHIKIGAQFKLPKKGAEHSKKDYKDYALDYIMRRIAELLPEDYRGIYK